MTSKRRGSMKTPGQRLRQINLAAFYARVLNARNSELNWHVPSKRDDPHRLQVQLTVVLNSKVCSLFGDAELPGDRVGPTECVHPVIGGPRFLRAVYGSFFAGGNGRPGIYTGLDDGKHVFSDARSRAFSIERLQPKSWVRG